MAKSVLFITTNAKDMGGHRETGVWFEEFMAPYRAFKEAGYDVVVTSPLGGETPIDDASLQGVDLNDYPEEVEVLKATRKAGDFSEPEFDALFFPGGHGPLYDLTENPPVKALTAQFADNGKPVGAVCHGPAALLNVRLANGRSLIDGRAVTGFSDTEEVAAGCAEMVPYSLEQELINDGGRYRKGEDWTDHVVADGNLFTGQNPQSSASIAKAMVDYVNRG